MKKIGWISLLIFWIAMPLAQSQNKFEKEERINVNEVPDKAKSFFAELKLENKAKWYREFSEDGISFETKTKLHKTLYSIEFDSAGNLKDVEYIIDFNHLNKNTKRNLENQLDSLYKKYRIIKTQRQYTGKPEVLAQLINTQKSNEPYTVKYEIVFSGKKESYRKKYELTADSTGKIISIGRVIPPEMNNLIY
jgi:hypothetical protein